MQRFQHILLLYILKTIREGEAQKINHTILVAPNNTGTPNDDLAFHEESAKKQLNIYVMISSKLNTLILMPIFPRPKSNELIYTHALDRDSIITEKEEFSRFDLQLLAMIDHAREKLKAQKVKTAKRIFITGFSASGMFANRFTFLHPDRVTASSGMFGSNWLGSCTYKTFKQKVFHYRLTSEILRR